VRTIAFLNNKGGVGTTTLVYHLACMFADQGHSVLAVDLDPQANLTSMFLEDDRLEELWPDGEHSETIYGAMRPIIRGLGDVARPTSSRSTIGSVWWSAISPCRLSKTGCPTPGGAARIGIKPPFGR
jgi:chromosome partitioning protein